MFFNLDVLIIAAAGMLKMGYYDHWRQRRYAPKGPEGDALKLRLDEEKRQANEKVAFKVFRACANLHELCISDFVKCTATRNGDGSVSQVHLSKGRRLKPTDVTD